jgi:uncharacterized cupin superfamily protein
MNPMTKIRIDSIREQELRSPNSHYHVFRKNISEALGGKKDTGTAGGGHPLDLELARLPPGAMNFPFHAHYAQWELFIFVSGNGELRGPDTTMPIGPGEAVMFPPGDAHCITNTGSEDLVYYVIADHPLADVIFYPDRGNWFVKPQRKCFTMLETSYYPEGT